MCNVSKGRVTQWITAGLIDGAAIVGEGQRALINVDLACAQLQERLATDERYGLNGLSTNISTTTISPGPRERNRKHSDIAFPPRPTRSKRPREAADAATAARAVAPSSAQNCRTGGQPVRVAGRLKVAG
jgi:hypothetical protein